VVLWRDYQEGRTIMNERPALIEEILQARQYITRAISTSSRQIWIDLDLSMAQLKTLMTLYDAGALPIGQIAENLGIGQPTASHLVDRLVQSGFVVRTEDPIDRRRTLAELSPQGVKLTNQLREVHTEPLQRWLAQLDDTTLAALHLGFRALADVAKAETTSISEAG
jgi:DNA-binding MarR family transcriptional regulator